MGNNTRLIARLDIKGPNLIKGVHLEGLRIIGSPNEYATKYYHQGIDEIIYIDCVASLYGRNHLGEIVREAAKDIFVPLTVGGGVRSVSDAKELLRAGADKIAVNTAVVKRPKLIREIASQFGNQCMVLSVQAKRINNDKWEVFTDNGRESTGLDVINWIQEGVSFGAGEILLTSIDREGTRKGFDIELIRLVANATNVPVIASGGMGNVQHLIDVVNNTEADAIAMADILHYNRSDVLTIRNEVLKAGLSVRSFG